MIELAARLGGGHDAELCELALGVDLNGAAIAAALGDPVGRLGRRAAGGRRLRAVPGRAARHAGGGRRLGGGAAADGVHDVRMYRPAGHMFGPLRRGADRAGAILATGESRDDALANADAAAERIVFRVH